MLRSVNLVFSASSLIMWVNTRLVKGFVNHAGAMNI